MAVMAADCYVGLPGRVISIVCIGDIRVPDYHDVDVGGGEVVMVAVRFVSVLLGKKPYLTKVPKC